MRQGKILAVGTFAELSARLPNAAPVFVVRAKGLDIHALARELQLKVGEDLSLEILATDGGKPLNDTLAQIIQRGGRIVDVQSRSATFEELFAHFAGEASA